MDKGLTLLELLLVIVIIGILATVGVPLLTTAKYNLSLKETTRSLMSFILLAKNKSAKGEKISLDFSDAHEIKLCKGNNCYCDVAEYSFKISNDIFLTSPLDCFVFDRGFPKHSSGAFAAETITLRHAVTNKCFNITISRTGRIKINACE